MDTDLLLSHFSPLIQLLAGIYLLFCYERIFDNNPLHSKLDEAKSRLSQFKQQYQLYVTDNIELTGLFTKAEKRWDNNLSALKRIYSILFFYCIFILFYAGFDTLNVANKQNFHHGLQAGSVLVFLYVITLWATAQYSIWIKRKRFLILTIVCFLLLFHFYGIANEFFVQRGVGVEWANRNTCISSIILSVSGFIVIGFIYVYSYLRVEVLNRNIDRLFQETKQLIDNLFTKKELKGLPIEKKVEIAERMIGQSQTIEEIFESVIKKNIEDRATVMMAPYGKRVCIYIQEKWNKHS